MPVPKAVITGAINNEQFMKSLYSKQSYWMIASMSGHNLRDCQRYTLDHRINSGANAASVSV